MAQPSEHEIREVYAALSRGDIDAVVSYAAEDIEYVNSQYALEGGVRHGRDTFREILHEILNTMSFDQQIEEIRDTGDEIVVVLTARARGAASGIAFAQEMVHALTWRDERLVRFRWFRDLDEAREAGVL